MNKEDFIKRITPKPYLITQEYDFSKRLESFKEIAPVIKSDFKIDEHNCSLYENGIKYFAGDPSSEFPLDKGLMVYGPYGTGKSFFFKMMDYLNQATWGKNGFQTLTIDQVIDGVSKNGQRFFADSGITYSWETHRYDETKKHMFLDDLCMSNDSVNYYGNSIDLIFNIIQRRYIAYTEARVLTHITTNLKPELFREAYGEAISSRIQQMFHPVLLSGPDRRK